MHFAEKVIEKIKLKERLNLKKENIIALLITVILMVLVLVDYYSNYQIIGILLVIELSALSLLVLFIMFRAGFTVMKALLSVGAYLSLLIFLGKSYCEIPNRISSGDNALKALSVVGILYISFYFFKSLYKGLSKKYEKLKSERETWEKIVFIALFLVFVVFYICVIWQVINPIIFNLCVFK